jgi:ATP-dependent Clp protease ATP-binding subunit ClpC
MSNHFTPRAQQALALAKKEAEQLNHNYIGTEHLLLGLLKLGQGLALKILQNIGIEPKDIYEIIEQEVDSDSSQEPQSSSSSNIPITPRVKKVIALAEKEAKQLAHSYVGTEHLLLGLIKEGEGVAAKVLKSFDVNFEEIKNEILKELDPNFKPQEMITAGDSNQHSDTPKKKGTFLKTYGKDLTELAENKQLDPVIGRTKEIERVIQILCRRTKNNPLLIGEAGVGKTAIAEGLAKEIITGNVPDVIKNKRVISLDLALVVAGTIYRGQFEERIKSIMSEVKKNGNVILFIDEIHTMVGAGAASGSMDASNIFKPALSRGELQIIGATTLSEHRKHIEKDAALERRFQQIIIEPPTIDQTIEILQGIRSKYEQHHKAKILDCCLISAAALAERYITNRFLPDKAIDLIDEAGSVARMKARTPMPDLSQIENEIIKLTEQKEEAIRTQHFEQAALIRDKEKKCKQSKQQILDEWNESKIEKEVIVGEDDIMKVLSGWTGIPLSKIEQKEAAKLLALEEELSKMIIGQPEAVSVISKALRRARADLKDPKRPIGSFLFLGPTGVGKTSLTHTLSELMFGTKDATIQIDMSEYMEKFSVSRLIGSPPGYVGYEEGGQLTEAVRRKPYSVVLFDEVEKAHPDALHILLQILEEGKITDSIGRKVDFRNTIIIMTSNVGAQAVKKQTSLGFGVKCEPSSDFQLMKTKTLEEAKQFFKPELLNRIDAQIVFQSLGKEDISKIVDIEMIKIIERIKAKNLNLILSESAKEFLIEKGYDEAYGARPMKRAIENYIENPLAEEILKETFKSNDTIIAIKKDNALIFELDKPKKQQTQKKTTTNKKPKQNSK